MTKIKYINCFGTSYTAGGGFEFETGKIYSRELSSYYSTYDEIQTQFNFSYPGQLQKLVGNSIKVYNHAKSGYGNDRLIRLAYDLINSENFNKEEHIFIFEFAGLGREEFFLNSLNDYIICNYRTEYDDNDNLEFKFNDIAKSYVYDDFNVRRELLKFKDLFETYVENFVNIDVEEKKLVRDADLFLSYLEKHEIKFLFSVPPILNYHHDNFFRIQFGDGRYFKNSDNFVKFTDDNNLRIYDETSGEINDMHSGLLANKLISYSIYNKLIEKKLIESSILNIDWKYYKSLT